MISDIIIRIAEMAELVDASDSKSGFPKESEGSIPSFGRLFLSKGDFTLAS